MSLLRAILAAARDLVLGDEPSLALLLGVTLAACRLLIDADLPAWWLLPAVVVGATAASLRRGRRGP